ncbi:PREDICTED: gastrula zinc finger protein XlCGF71.1-like isoform X1 [Diuraphis noxia]|uniref:gastrula zinc finger protein XlCGF71.1-like isoform X1 n=1 Tax=Diuraphis noxia TaxID=143948 RepID=UPI000763B689|nr:PREDICTED: gastrula zinc finger protein XlCGF71.1-like isoform X1 [Diuraphis noxia]
MEDLETRAKMDKRIDNFLKFLKKEEKENQTLDHAVAVKTIKKSKPRFTCSVCGSSFKEKHHILRHCKIHLNEKPFMCDVCKKTFRDQSNYTNHIYTHTDEKRFQCAQCGKKFIKKDNLVVHCRTHSHEKPYNCNVCNKSFTTSGNCRRHFQNKHKKIIDI